MFDYITRGLEEKIKKRIAHNPVTAILGPRQCGKSTLAKKIINDHNNSVYIDLEKPSDLRKLNDPELFFEIHKDKLICLDEIQLKPELFSTLRAVVDISGINGQFLLLGSASRDLIMQSSETLAGRISYIELSPFTHSEIITISDNLWNLLLRGGFPRSFLAVDDEESFNWRENFVRTFLEKDIPQLGFNIPAKRLERFWSMTAHVHGQLFNSSKIGGSLGVSHNTVRNHLDILEQTFLLRVLLPYEANIKKRLVKTPKVYIRDSGLLHYLLNIETIDELLGHPSFGASWEGFVIENIISNFRRWKYYFYRSSNGAEIDLIMEKGVKKIAVECKISTAPKITKGFWNSLDDLEISDAWIIAPVNEAYRIEERVMVSNLDYFMENGGL